VISIAGEAEGKLPGFHYPTMRLRNGFSVQAVYWFDDPEHDDAWADTKALAYGGRQSPGWRREMEIELVRGGQPIWPMLCREVHVRDDIPFAALLTDAWTLYRSLDAGLRHDTCCAWVAINKDGDRYFYRQYYKNERTIALNAKAILQLTEPSERIAATVADPSIWQREPTALRLVADLYAQAGLPLVHADNSRAGYDTLTAGFYSALARWSIGNNYNLHPRLPEGLKPPDLEKLASVPAIWFHPTVADGPKSLYEQTANLRWKEIRGDPLKHAPSEDFEDVDDEGPDVVRYACQTPLVRWRSAVGTPMGLRDILARAWRRQERRERRGRFD
jgi:hypothetical protein